MDVPGDVVLRGTPGAFAAKYDVNSADEGGINVDAIVRGLCFLRWFALALRTERKVQNETV